MMFGNKKVLRRKRWKKNVKNMGQENTDRQC